MDPTVRRAMARWPQVPAVYGYLGLNRTGRFLLEGQPVQHPRLLAFIGRNYGVDEQGRAFFQNGPQRAFVDLECTPWVAHLGPDGGLRAHTGAQLVPAGRALIMGDGDVVVETRSGPALVHHQSLAALAERLHGGGDDQAPGIAGERLALADGDCPCVEGGSWPLAGVVRTPRPDPDGEPAAVAGTRPAWVHTPP